MPGSLNGWQQGDRSGGPFQPADRMGEVGNRAQHDAARPQHTGAFAQHGSGGADVLQDARRDNRVEAGRCERQCLPARLQRHPLGRAGGIGRGRLAQHVRPRCHSRSPAARRRPDAGPVPRYRSRDPARVPRRGRGIRPRQESCASRPVSRPSRRVFGGPAGRLGVEKRRTSSVWASAWSVMTARSSRRHGSWRASWPAWPRSVCPPRLRRRRGTRPRTDGAPCPGGPSRPSYRPPRPTGSHR